MFSQRCSTELQTPRDPRFLATAGSYDAKLFQQSYGFLAENRKMELQTLRESLSKARRMLASSPAEFRNERESEVARLEHAVKRAESTVNKDRLERLEREALSMNQKAEEGKRREGKGKWFLKKGEADIVGDKCLISQTG